MTSKEQSGGLPPYTISELLLQEPESYDFAQRLEWLHGCEAAQFIPTSTDELNTAFNRMYSSAQGVTASQDLQTIRMSQQRKTRSADVIAAEIQSNGGRKFSTRILRSG